MTATKTTEPETVRVERLLPHPPRRVWRALTKKDAIEKWLLPITSTKDNDRDKPLDTPGASVTLRAEPSLRVAYEVADAEPERNLSLWWRVRSSDTDETITTRVTWTLTPEQDGAATRLVIEHKPFGLTALAGRAAAPWSGVMARLAVYFELGETQRRSITRCAARRIEEKIRCH
jgi:uncharacterized protein YndB with AHSA1/START domain